MGLICKNCGERISDGTALASTHVCITGTQSDDVKDPHRQYAKNLINSSALLLDERKAYGTLIDDFTVTAELWSTYLGIQVTPAQVTQLMVLLKIGRTKSGVYVEDNYADQIGYAGITAALAYPDTDPGSTLFNIRNAPSGSVSDADVRAEVAKSTGLSHDNGES